MGQVIDERVIAGFWARVDRRGPDECWPWVGTLTSKGYGEYRPMRGVYWRASRLSWTIAHGPIPPGLQVCHSCDVRYPAGDRTYRRCCNEAHLWLGTDKQNTRDMVEKGRKPRSGGGPVGPANGNYKHGRYAR